MNDMKYCPDYRRYIDEYECRLRKTILCQMRPQNRGRMSCATCTGERPEKEWTPEDVPTTCTKTCRKCSRILPLSAFVRDRRNRDGHAMICRECASKRMRDWRKRTRDAAKTVAATMIMGIMLTGAIYALMTGAADQQDRLQASVGATGPVRATGWSHQVGATSRSPLRGDAVVIGVSADQPPTQAEMRRHGVLWASYDMATGHWYTDRRDGRIWYWKEAGDAVQAY